jgi:hypothetical protein
MPGTRGKSDRDKMLQVRVQETDLARWRAYVGARGGYLGVLVRRAVEHWISTYTTVKGTPQLYDDGRSRYS